LFEQFLGFGLIRQLLASLLVLAAAALAWLFLVPGAPETLARVGIVLPFGPAPQAEANAGPRGPGGAGRGGPGGFAGRATNVVTGPVNLVTINQTLNAIGEGTPARSVTVTTPSTGTLAEILVRPGQRVEAGDVIARFDAEAEQIEFDRAQLAADDAAAALARTSGLASSNVVASTALAAAELANANAQLALRSAQLALERRTISSPIAGVVGLMQVNPGNYVGAQTVVTTVDDTSAILIDFWVPERYATQITTDMPVEVTAVAQPGRSFTGNISVIDNRIDPASRTLQVQAEIPNEDNVLRAGMSFSVSLAFPGEEYPAVNPLSILWSAEGSYVWKYEDGAATKVMAEIVQRNSDGVLVRADLEPGDAVITEGILQLSEGTPVTVLEGPGAEDSRQAAAN
jgi:RND family efflux transporter MFP subunit